MKWGVTGWIYSISCRISITVALSHFVWLLSSRENDFFTSRLMNRVFFFFKLQCTHFIQKQTHKFTWFPWKKKHESFGCAGQNSYINDTLLIFYSRCLHMSTLSVEMFPTSQAQHWESSVNETHMHWKNECWTWWLISVFPVFLRKVSKVRWVNTKQQAQLG